MLKGTRNLLKDEETQPSRYEQEQSTIKSIIHTSFEAEHSIYNEERKP